MDDATVDVDGEEVGLAVELELVASRVSTGSTPVEMLVAIVDSEVSVDTWPSAPHPTTSTITKPIVGRMCPF